MGTKKRELISVIIPVYNAEKYLEKCVNSVLGQTYRDLEVILIDDGSFDRCPTLCDSYAITDNRVRVIHKQNGGLASARNVGLDIATGDLIAFVDSDDWIDPTAYEEMLEMKSKTNAAIVCCGGIDTDGDQMFGECLNCKPTGTVLDGGEVTKEILLDKIGSQVVKGLYEYNCWESIRFPIGRLYEDIPITYRVFERAKKVAYIKKPFYKYRLNMNSISYTPNPIKTYHIYLGLKDHYEYSVTHYPDISRECCSTVAHYAVSTFFHYCTDAHEELKLCRDDVCAFLDAHRNEIDFGKIIKSRRYALRIYYFSKQLFRIMCTLIYKTNLQKAMHFEVK